MEIYAVIVESKIISVEDNLELYKTFCAFYSSIHLYLFLKLNNFLFNLDSSV